MEEEVLFTWILDSMSSELENRLRLCNCILHDVQSIEHNITPVCQEELVYEPIEGKQEVGKPTTSDSISITTFPSSMFEET